jgi:hypothetical protein
VYSVLPYQKKTKKEEIKEEVRDASGRKTDTKEIYFRAEKSK